MTNLTERRLGWGFGLLGGLLIVLGALVSLVVSAADLVVGRFPFAIDAGVDATVLFVVGLLALFFAYLARGPWSDRPISGGVLLAVVAFLGWVFVGVGGNVLALIGLVFVFLSGILFLVSPAVTGLKRLATA
ncbi:MAG TPA: hypothetical protein VGS18_05545 [Thermoplasmata archaeon]|nr:hypothetical protein [Thermoplasmata archaeon]